MKKKEVLIVGFSRRRGFAPASWAIQMFQGFTPYSHTYITYVDEVTNNGMVFEASHGRVRLVSLGKWAEQNITYHESYVSIDADDYQEFRSFAMSTLTAPYSFANILGIFIRQLTGLNLLRDGRTAYICSELVAYALRGVYKFDKPLDYVTPQDIYKKVVG